MEDFRDFTRAIENTMAMSIGKFNFASLKAADEMAAWIFFVFASKKCIITNGIFETSF